MLDPTDDVTVITQAVFDNIDRDKAELGIERVFYGDQNKVSEARTVCVEPALLKRELSGHGASNRTFNTIQVYILVYIIRADTVEEITKEGDVLATMVMNKLHEDTKLDGLVVTSFVNLIEFGYSRRPSGWWRTARITWQATNLTYINVPGSQ